ncbi:unnamed protein product [Durusdinium trenchii]|uniref:Uncharacterized protein n=1 Tax=Durusdinium trenchii TaxID=1381693 RepID=A0ABP0I1V7_9DINO
MMFPYFPILFVHDSLFLALLRSTHRPPARPPLVLGPVECDVIDPERSTWRLSPGKRLTLSLMLSEAGKINHKNKKRWDELEAKMKADKESGIKPTPPEPVVQKQGVLDSQGAARTVAKIVVSGHVEKQRHFPSNLGAPGAPIGFSWSGTLGPRGFGASTVGCSGACSPFAGGLDRRTLFAQALLGPWTISCPMFKALRRRDLSRTGGF